MEILLKRNKQSTSSLPSSLSPGEPLWFKDQLYIGSVGTALGGSYTSGYPVPITGGGGGGSSTLSGLTDTAITSPSGGEILSYDSANSVWVNSAAPSGLPSQSGNSGKYLTTDGSSASWATISIPSAPGTLNTTAATAQSTSASEALSGNITLHKVAKTGTYSDLIGTPTIPTVNNATLTIQKNGTNVATFTANASSNVTANISVPSAPGTLNTTATTAQSTSSSEALSGNITLHKVAKTGTYSDLIGTPTIPTVNNATLTIQKNGTTVNTFTANASSNVTANITVNEVPSVTSSDDGKFLKVSSGAWSAQTVSTVQMQVTFTDNSTQTYNVYIQ